MFPFSAAATLLLHPASLPCLVLERAKITAGELVVVLSHFDLGPIESVERFRGGSRHTPKVLLKSVAGEFLLKRRSVGSSAVRLTGENGATEHPNSPLARIRRAHAVHHCLREKCVPVPDLIPTRAGQTFLNMPDGHGPAHGVYEVFRFLRGVPYARSTDHARAAGHLLALFHSATAALTLDPDAAMPGYHRRAEMDATLEAIRIRLDDPRARPLLRSLLTTYQRAALEAETLGASRFPPGVVHADWHPGNLVFQEPALPSPILGIVDLDSARVSPRLLDVANGAMQFAIHRAVRDGDPSAWRITVSPPLMGAFCAGYRSAAQSLDSVPILAPSDWAALPWLMCEALIAEAAAPIAATGRFGRLDPLPLLALVDQTATSILAEHERLVSICQGS